MMYYVFCVIMGQSEEVFYKSSIGKIVKMIALHHKITTQEHQEMEVQQITSMKEIEGW